MAQALECPACGARHPVDTLPATRTFRCDRCGQTLKVPDVVAANRPLEPPPRRGGAAPSKRGRTRVHWYWRLLAWIVAVPLGLLFTAWPALHFDLLKKDDLLDVFVGEGSGRYVRLLVFAAAWAFVTALLVSLFVEGGRWLALRRRAG